MPPPIQLHPHLPCVLAGARLAQNVAVQHYLVVRGDDDGWTDGARRNQLGLGIGQPLHQLLWRFPRFRSFIDRRREHHERNPRVVQDFCPASRIGSKNQLHEQNPGAAYHSDFVGERGENSRFCRSQMTTDSWY